ncbi:MAG: flagellar export chaperone FliS [Acidimicrobiales bacterium]
MSMLTPSPSTLPTPGLPTAVVPGRLAAPATNGRVAAAKSRYHQDGKGAMSGERLVVLLYQRLVRDLNGANLAIEQGMVEPAHHHLVHAQEIVDQLDAALDRSAWSSAAGLGDLYDFVRRQLVQANITKQSAPVTASLRVIEPLATAWEEALAATTATTTTAGTTAAGSLTGAVS